MWDAILDALVDSAKTLPILLAVYLLVEFMEHKGSVKFEKIVASSKKYGPLWGAGLGVIPQCSFSAVIADLFSRKMVTIGTLFAVFVATSDEAFAILLSSPQNAGSLLVLVACKLLLAIIIGFVLDLLVKNQSLKADNLQHNTHFNHEHTHKHDKKQNANVELCETCKTEEDSCDTCKHDHLHHEHEIESETPQNKSKIVWDIILQALKHTLEIFAYILIANIAISLILHFVGGEEAIKSVISASSWYLPIVCALIGLIPNCAGSVALAELYISGIISFSACLGGLCASAGVGLLVLFKNNKNTKQNLLITLILFLFGSIIGLLFNLFMPVKI